MRMQIETAERQISFEIFPKMVKKWFLVAISQINLVRMESLVHEEEVATLFDTFCMSQRKLPEEIRVPCFNTHCL